MTWEDWYNHPAYKASSSLTLTAWVSVEEMTEAEKKSHSCCVEQGGCLRVYTYREAWAALWAKLSEREKNSFLTLPNFDAKKFEFITGIKVDKNA